ncbi:F0F1 ATP synthase subunit C [Meiothermus sp. QL-1]|uniref:F0F1 ATP synthase subunit C n=1 Tax=Meiothermus sp. QL-1 TaxID=2058095 RepID=UPI000E0B52F8|nr:F0F1 ATP synthase subunit C [Meiothermus sp. QL-1]RDI96574.1 F0F1 ATP synthase subunit C [Meiothermus sp. QL-1]
MKNAKLFKAALIVAVVVMATLAFAAEEGATVASLAPIGKGLAIGLGLLGTGMAQSAIGAAAVGAVAEDRRNFGTALIFFLIPETLAIFGLAFSFLIN